MKFQRKITLYLLLYSALYGAAFAQVVHIPDRNLHSAIRESLNLPPGLPLTPAAIRSLTSLDAGDRGIVDLTGLEHATELTLLIIPRNQISDLAPIAALTKLEFLAIADNPISDIIPLSNLEKLRRFDVSGCRISDINPLANLTQLTRIDLRYNAITDIQPLADLVRLEQLALTENRITDVSPLVGLSRLETLDIERNLIADHSPVDTLSLDHFVYDEACDMLPLPLEPRLENRTFPRYFLHGVEDGQARYSIGMIFAASSHLPCTIYISPDQCSICVLLIPGRVGNSEVFLKGLNRFEMTTLRLIQIWFFLLKSE